MAGLIDWIFPCFGIAGSQGPADDTRKGTKELPEESHSSNNAQYRPTGAGSMYYSGRPLTLEVDNVAEDRRKGTVDAKKSGPAYEMKAVEQRQDPTLLSQARSRTARPKLAVCIPNSNSKPPVFTSCPSPDNALDNQQTSGKATPTNKANRSGGTRAPPTAPRSAIVETPNTSASVRFASDQLSAQANPSETPTYTRWVRAHADQTAVQQPKYANLKDELDCFSIASGEEELSAYDEEIGSAVSAKMVSALRSSEVMTSVHDFAHEEHRDFANRLTPNTLHLARRIVGRDGTSSEESKDELKMNAGRRLC
ncbi:MAG: hypothetical protein Q9211_003191 [Gyalolechia sp. 1 TL-2023]